MAIYQLMITKTWWNIVKITKYSNFKSFLRSIRARQSPNMWTINETLHMFTSLHDIHACSSFIWANFIAMSVYFASICQIECKNRLWQRQRRPNRNRNETTKSSYKTWERSSWIDAKKTRSLLWKEHAIKKMMKKSKGSRPILSARWFFSNKYFIVETSFEINWKRADNNAELRLFSLCCCHYYQNVDMNRTIGPYQCATRYWYGAKNNNNQQSTYKIIISMLKLLIESVWNGRQKQNESRLRDRKKT